jgi:hypothetical protein
MKRGEVSAASEARQALGEAEVEWSKHVEGLRSALEASQHEVARLANHADALREENEGLTSRMEASEERHKAAQASLQVRLVLCSRYYQTSISGGEPISGRGLSWSEADLGRVAQGSPGIPPGALRGSVSVQSKFDDWHSLEREIA